MALSEFWVLVAPSNNNNKPSFYLVHSNSVAKSFTSLASQPLHKGLQNYPHVQARN